MGVEQEAQALQEVLKREKVRIVSVDQISDFPDHPFGVRDDEEMAKLIRSIRENGVLAPLILRKTETDGYEVISGHRRKYACQRLGLTLVPAIVREISRDEAIISMVDSNLQRERILPAEISRCRHKQNK